MSLPTLIDFMGWVIELGDRLGVKLGYDRINDRLKAENIAVK